MKNIFIVTFIFASIVSFSQAKSRMPNKSLKDTFFNKGDIIKIPKIIYDLSYPIRPDSKDSLVLVAMFLKTHPTIKFEIGCHTDNRGPSDSNSKLSDFRAEYVWQFLIKDQGVDPNMLTYKGYGETSPIISDKEILKVKTIKEKEKLYQINRRTELRVIETK